MLKKDGFKVWAETGTDRWTKLTLTELRRRCAPTEPEQIDVDAFRKDWGAEVKNAICKTSFPKVMAGSHELIFTSNLVDISQDQVIVNKAGESVVLDDRSYVAAIAKNVMVQSHDEGIILAAQLFVKDKTLIAPNTWEWRRDLIDHRDKNTSPLVSVAIARSGRGELYLNSHNADNSNGNNRLRLALILRGFCFFEPLADFFADGNNHFQLGAIPAMGNEFSVQSDKQ